MGPRGPASPSRRRRRCVALCVLEASLVLLAAPAFRSYGSSQLAFAAPSGPPSSGELLKALGRELWVIGDELLTVSARIKLGATLGTGGISLRNAADLMLDGNWEDVMGELETAAVSCDAFVPYDAFEGMVNLFSYYEPMPDWEWMSARNSLVAMSDCIKKSQMDMLRNLDGPFRRETSDSIDFIVERLKKASKLFEPGGFYMPPKDPRDKVDREGRGKPRQPEPRPFEWAKGPQNEEAYRMRYVMDTLRKEAQVAVEAAGQRSLAILERVDGELAAAESMAQPDQARRSALRRLLRELHPDRNQERQADVRPVFEYIVKLRDQTK